MKKYLLFAACAAMLASCSDDNPNDKPVEPVTPGTEVNFTLHLDGSDQSRTIYGDETTINGVLAFPIYWVNGDNVLLASPQCSVNKATYSVTVDGANQNYATSMDKVGSAGLQWGTETVTNFYSVYPTEYVTDVNDESVKNALEPQGQSAVAHLNVRNYQINVFTKDEQTNTWKGVPIDRKSMTSIDDNHKNPDAIMYAQKKHDSTTEGNVVKLNYKPFTVAFHVTLDGYEIAEGLGTTDPGVTVQEVMISAPSTVTLAGNFDATFNTDCNTPPTVNTSVNTLEAKNVIHIPTLNNVNGHYLDIQQGEKIEFNVFAIPTAGIVTSDWTLTVRTTSGTYTRKLTPSSAESGALAVGQMHKLNMPTFQISNGFQFDITKWISQIPRNVYLSELSIPGAWYCYNSQYQATTELDAQWNAGVRAFHIDCRLSNNSGQGDNKELNEMTLACAGTESYSGVGAAQSNLQCTTVLEELQNINKLVSEHPTEYAVAVLTIAEKPRTNSGIFGSYTYGTVDQTKILQAIASILTTANLSNLYTTPITSSTTVNDVLGKLIVKINTTDAGPYTGTVPSTLMSKASLASDAIYGVMQNSDMYWGNGTSPQTDGLKYYYMQAQRTYTTGSSSPQMTSRENAIDNIISQSVTVYQSSTNNAWFQMGIGGYVKNSDRDSEDRVSVAQTLNQYLQQRVEAKAEGTAIGGTTYAPSPVGIVLANFITTNTQDGTNVYGLDLINSIIKMNRKIRLNRDENQPEWPNSESGQQNSPANYSMVNNNGGNAWNITK